MDALALLCNLHGDGPVTLTALRDLGCEDLVGLEALGESLLGDILGRDERGVQRFRREARLLGERLDGESRTDAPAPIAVIAPQPPPVASPEPEPEPPQVAAADRGPVVSAVLDLWRQFDHPVEPTSVSNVLAEVTLSGLKPDDVVALARVGVRTLEELAEADLLSLTEGSGLPYTHVAHLAFLARKLCDRKREEAPLVPAPATATVGSEKGAKRSLEGHTEDGPAGPFA